MNMTKRGFLVSLLALIPGVGILAKGKENSIETKLFKFSHTGKEWRERKFQSKNKGNWCWSTTHQPIGCNIGDAWVTGDNKTFVWNGSKWTKSTINDWLQS